MTRDAQPGTRYEGNNRVYETIAHLLRSETAQTLGYVVVQLAALAEVDDLPALRERLLAVRGEVRDELRHILALVDDLELAGRTA